MPKEVNKMSENSSKDTLIRLMQLGHNDYNAERKKIVPLLPKELEDWKSGELVKRELLLSESVEGTGLIQTYVSKTVVDGAKLVTCMREACFQTQMLSNSLNYPFGASGGYVTPKAEGAEATVQYQDYGYRALTALNYVQTAPISQEMVDDAMFDVIGKELEKLGQNMENTIDRKMIDQLVANAGLTKDTAGANQGIIAVIGAKAAVIGAGFRPDTLVMHPDLWAKVFEDYKPAYNERAEGILQSGELPPILGMKPYVCGITATTSTNWDYDTGDDFGGLVYDKFRGSVLGMRQDIKVKYAEKPFNMVIAPVCNMRMDGAYVNADAICKIKF